MAATGQMTFDELSSTYRVEKTTSTLAPVRKDLYSAMAELLNTQIKECERIALSNIDSIMYDGAAERKRKINHLIKQIVEMRTQKIADMAIRNAMGSNVVIDMLTAEEKTYFQTITEVSRQHLSLANCKKKVVIPDVTNPSAPVVEESVPEPVPVMDPVPTIPAPVAKTEDPVIEEEPEEIPVPIQDIPLDDFPPEKDFEIPEEEESFPVDPNIEEKPIETAPIKPVELPADGFVTLRILEDLPPFSGPDRTYKLVKEDVVRMPSMMASALINRGIASLISMS